VHAALDRSSFNSRFRIASRRVRGFTLLELLVTLFIAALVVGLAAPRFQNSVAGMRLRGESREVAALLRQSRSLAIARAEPVELIVDPEAGVIRYASDIALYTPSASIELRLPGEGLPAGTALRIRFYPDGTSSGGRFAMAANERVYEISVDWLTGRVTVG